MRSCQELNCKIIEAEAKRVITESCLVAADIDRTLIDQDNESQEQTKNWM
ncbi:hypothetical protein MHK_005331 [Candidatus Magnetomorum sp. HK-1]|nr:hypothetical protein MHK_005331 [Candidatus Magnetomorum sp. HK-1]